MCALLCWLSLVNCLTRDVVKLHFTTSPNHASNKLPPSLSGISAKITWVGVSGARNEPKARAGQQEFVRAVESVTEKREENQTLLCTTSAKGEDT